MKWPRSRTVENEGILRVAQVVNWHGSIFREIHQEKDIGIDGIIEIVKNQEAEGLLVAVQVKSGESYTKDNKFVVDVNQNHLDYWQNFMLPVVIICYSPNSDLLAWRSVNRYIESCQKDKEEPIKSIEIPFHNIFDGDAISKGLYGVALERKDERLLFKSADLVLSDDADKRQQGLLILASHPASRSTRLIVNLASRMVLDEDIENVKIAISTLGACIAPTKWAWSYNNPNWDVAFYAQRCCFNFDGRHIRRMMEAINDGYFGRRSIGEACIDCIRSIPNGENFTREIVLDKDADPKTRINALALFYAGDWESLREDEPRLRKDGLGDLLDWLQENSE
jgi:hypothetical protein